jgi:hypothetical protein
MDELTLHQFLYSHFNEKARWALDHKGIPHQRRAYLPGPHRPAMQRLSGQGPPAAGAEGTDRVLCPLGRSSCDRLGEAPVRSVPACLTQRLEDFPAVVSVT